MKLSRKLRRDDLGLNILNGNFAGHFFSFSGDIIISLIATSPFLAFASKYMTGVSYESYE